VKRDLAIIGKPGRRIDGRAKVRGETKFADDLSLPRMLHMKLLRSPHPHARIVSIAKSKALDVPGVKLVLTGEDMPVPFGILPVSQDEHALCLDKVRFVGDPVAAVVAQDEWAAEEGCRALEVEYQPLATIATPEEALAVSEPRIHDYGDEGNVHKKVAFDFGDVDEAIAKADRVFEDLFYFCGNTHLPIEEHATLAALDPDGKITVWSSTQTPHYLHRALAKVLGTPAHLIRVIATPNGGGFGGKTDPFNHEIACAKAAIVLGRPVKICLTREEVFYCHRGRHPVLMRIKTGVKNDGTLLGQELDTLLDGGAYGSYGVASTFYTGALQTVTYHLPRYKFRGCRTFTNKPPCGPKRGHGTPQPRFGLEIQLDKIACALGIDPAEIRLKQLAKPGEITANWLRISTMNLGRCIDKVVEGSRWKERRAKLGTGRGLGLACSSYLSGAGLPIYWNDLPHTGVQLRLDRSGEVTAFCGATEVGQGSDHVLAACVAEILGLEPFDVRVVTGDTSLTPVDLGSYSSRVTLMMGNAAIQAAERARDLVADAVSDKLAVPRSSLVFADKQVFAADDPAKKIAWRDALVLAEGKHGTLGTVGSYKPPAAPGHYKGAGVGPSAAYSYSAAVIEVEVSVETGWYRVVKVWMAHDLGRAINTTLARGQVEGSVYMGLGEVVMEEQAFRRLPARLSSAHVHKQPSMLEYKNPTTLDMPPVETYLIEDPDPNGPFGAKEVGQGPLLPIMPAVANAIYDAVGVRIDELPITPDRILRALDEKKKGGPGRIGPRSFPAITWPTPLNVPPPWEGGTGHATNEEQTKKPKRSKVPS
jgi:4-hydroxybenzoyl-CoA reductase alpha subunit